MCVTSPTAVHLAISRYLLMIPLDLMYQITLLISARDLSYRALQLPRSARRGDFVSRNNRMRFCTEAASRLPCAHQQYTQKAA